jgi:hypothetical protein
MLLFDGDQPSVLRQHSLMVMVMVRLLGVMLVVMLNDDVLKVFCE